MKAMNKKSYFGGGVLALALLATLVPSQAQAQGRGNPFARSQAVLPPPPIGGNRPASGSATSVSELKDLFEGYEISGIYGNHVVIRSKDRVYFLQDGQDFYFKPELKYHVSIQGVNVTFANELVKPTPEKPEGQYDTVLVLRIGTAEANKRELTTGGSSGGSGGSSRSSSR
jgi:hypothetical protein